MAYRFFKRQEDIPIPKLPGMDFHDPAAPARAKGNRMRVQDGVAGVFDETIDGRSALPTANDGSTSAREYGGAAGPQAHWDPKGDTKRRNERPQTARGFGETVKANNLEFNPNPAGVPTHVALQRPSSAHNPRDVPDLRTERYRAPRPAFDGAYPNEEVVRQHSSTMQPSGNPFTHEQMSHEHDIYGDPRYDQVDVRHNQRPGSSGSQRPGSSGSRGAEELSSTAPVGRLPLDQVRRSRQDEEYLKIGELSDRTRTLELAQQQDTWQYPYQAWVAHDKKVLRFYAHFTETPKEEGQERRRLRRVVIFYYLEDGSIQIDEPKETNSGTVQGAFLKRARIPRDPPRPGRSKFLQMEDFNVGRKVVIYSRCFELIGCDPFTRSFLGREGQEVPADRPYPDQEDHGQIYLPRREPEPTSYPRKGHFNPPQKKSFREEIKKFIDMDRKVLRFFAVWDTRAEDPLDGDRRSYVLHYYLQDDTIEILEVCERNSGRDPFPKLLNRGRLPKQVYSVGARPMSDLTKKRMNLQYYSCEDLKIGEYLKVYNRNLLLHDCDDFTRAYYIEELGWSPQMFAPVPIQDTVYAAQQEAPPPHNGFGREEDSILNCQRLVPKVHLRDVHNFQANDGKVLRFVGYIVDDPLYPLRNTIDAERQFVITFHVVDGTLAIFEPPQRNSGIHPGKFLERSEVKKPGSKVSYRANDLYLGAKLIIHCRCFQLEECDDYTTRYMEDSPGVFPRSDPRKVLPRVRDLLGLPHPDTMEDLRNTFIEADRSGRGEATFPVVEAILARCGCAGITKQEVMTVMRTAAGNMEGPAGPVVNIANLLECLGGTQ